ncbi:MAG TPA: sigma 54-interacting transcriptional regulator, partial [Planctomycetota bacterium]|nr:sigma 54-interacting transcriptional regulator [Planctomycetota bacterium]
MGASTLPLGVGRDREMVPSAGFNDSEAPRRSTQGPGPFTIGPPIPIIGSSSAIEEVRAFIRAFASARRAKILIRGRSGTGKELLARHLHYASPERHRPFVAINCAAIAGGLMESQLFGHEKGAFTGADRRKKGYFELAHGGTLFLDEIGELPIDVQAKLLR